MVKKSLFIILFGGMLSVLLSCFPTEHYLIVGIRFTGVEEIDSGSTEDQKYFLEIADRMQDKLFFEIAIETEYQYRSSLNNYSFNTLYATSLPYAVDNKIVLDSLELVFDKDIYYNGDTIFGGEDLWNHPQIGEYKWIQESDDYSVIGFQDEFYETIVIPEQKYVIRLKCFTDDDKDFNEEVEYFLDI